MSLPYAAVAGRGVPLGGESGQQPTWIDLDQTSASVFSDDRIRAYVRMRTAGQVSGVR
ncbi:hypothetical protein G3I59_21215 [Amycolatopsis rubida]|uniref:Uncharacterized protein n=1 Tax=Amycolatopsis rubida TaxID=112413 RepID=A0ABX0BXN3_9PSEU|nr:MULTISPECIES: hypothetical protein [Amycolatopsis]MYW93065.1 hypothetical protein [Amycolatopsis rubida]NEC58052.1 hypothetical protein [Amycolatopsis rubida]